MVTRITEAFRYGLPSLEAFPARGWRPGRVSSKLNLPKPVADLASGVSGGAYERSGEIKKRLRDAWAGLFFLPKEFNEKVFSG